MSYQNISVAMIQTDIDTVKTSLATITSKLPFLIALDIEERKTLFKLGPKSADFVNDASGAAANFPGILPTSFDKTEYGKDTALFKVLADMKILVDSLKEKLDDTYMAVGSEAMIASLEVYAYVQTAADRTPGLKSVADKLKDRFRAQGARKKAVKTASQPNNL